MPFVNEHFLSKNISSQSRHTTQQFTWNTGVRHSAVARTYFVHNYERGCYGVCGSVAMETAQLVLGRRQTHQRHPARK